MKTWQDSFLGGTFLFLPRLPGADDLAGAVSGRQLLQQVVREVDLPEVEEAPGHHRGQRRQAVGRQVQVGDGCGDVHEPVELQPGQL